MISFKWVAVVTILAIHCQTISTQRNPYRYDDLPPGPYCAAKGCCNNRQDQCSAPILGTMCYCDEFCDQADVNDCCPDYWSHCKGAPPPPPPTTPEPAKVEVCTQDGRNYGYGETFKKNCNLCECKQIGNSLTVLCERNPCTISPLIIETVNREGKYSWTASNYSKFWGKTLDEAINTRLGTLQPERFVMNMNPVKKIYNPNDLPKQFDASLNWPNYITDIQEQGDCAASWAISTVAVASDRFAIMSKGREIVQLSAQDLISCDRKGQQSCRGGHVDKAWSFITRFGLVDEQCFPYSGFDVPCKIDIYGDLGRNGCKIPYNQRTSHYMVGPAYRLGNETDIMYEILSSGPVQATMLVHNDFYAYGGGIYERTDILESSRTGFLSVRIVGWGEEYTYQGPKKYWKIANSWGKDWGEDGYFRIVRGRDESEIESFVIAAQPEVERKRYSSYPVQPE